MEYQVTLEELFLRYGNVYKQLYELAGTKVIFTYGKSELNPYEEHTYRAGTIVKYLYHVDELPISEKQNSPFIGCAGYYIKCANEELKISVGKFSSIKLIKPTN